MASKDAATDGSSGPRNVRMDLYRKFRDGDAMPSIPPLPPYTIATDQISARGLLRFGIHRPLAFADVNEIKWGIIYRRSLVIELRGEFLPRAELRGAPDVAANVDAMSDFV